jgi:ABC-type Fe3+/spermidine/putrescine transport system ATPase subunit
MKNITFESVSKYYDGRSAVCDFSLDIPRGERLVILGPSGCGKTTVLRLLAGFIAPDRGTIEIDEKIVATHGRNVVEPERRHLGMVFQDLALWPHLTVRGNLEFGLKAQGVLAHQRTERIIEMLKLVHMESYMNSKPAQLSGGEQQRVALTRALILKPKALLMDEPLSSLDLELNMVLRKEIVRLHKEIGFTLLYVTHNREEAFEIGNRVVVMSQGSIKRIGPIDQIREYFEESLQS